jgi:hypothetical protein
VLKPQAPTAGLHHPLSGLQLFSRQITVKFRSNNLQSTPSHSESTVSSNSIVTVFSRLRSRFSTICMKNSHAHMSLEGVNRVDFHFIAHPFVLSLLRPLFDALCFVANPDSSLFRWSKSTSFCIALSPRLVRLDSVRSRNRYHMRGGLLICGRGTHIPMRVGNAHEVQAC